MSRELFSREQLAKLTHHTAEINAILAEALLNVLESKVPFEPDGEQEMELEIHIVDTGCVPEMPAGKTAEEAMLDDLCGSWKGGWKAPDLRIFKTDTGYMAVYGNPKNKKDFPEQYPIGRVNNNLCLQIGIGYVYLSYNPADDKLKLYPGGTYTRLKEEKK